MKTIINIDNYEEIMFRLMEDDFDNRTRTDLLHQIQADELFKFEWELWQKTKIQDPVENYAYESRELTDKILLIAEPKPVKRKLFFYFVAAASILMLLGTLFFLNADHKSVSQQAVNAPKVNIPITVKQSIPMVQEEEANQDTNEGNRFQETNPLNETVPIFTDSSFITNVTTLLAEIQPTVDSVPLKTIELAKAPEKKPRYTITIETSDIVANNQQNNDLAQNRNVKINKLFTNTKMWLSRKPNGEPDKIYIVGDENSYLCINLNY